MITGGLEERCEQNTVKSTLLRPSVVRTNLKSYVEEYRIKSGRYNRDRQNEICRTVSCD